MKKVILLFVFLLLLSSCNKYITTDETYDSEKDIVILYTNALTTEDNQREFYSNISAYKKSILETTPNVTLVDTGNISDTDIWTYNLFIDVMNGVGYDYACFGLYDFKNGLEYLYSNIKQANYKYLLCCASYNGHIRDPFKKTKPYEVVDYDGIKIGYIGVISPRFVVERPNYFIEKDNNVINFYNETEEVFYDTVQCSIDKVKQLGADYVVLISNFDNDVLCRPYTIKDLIINLSDVNLVINANEYSKNEELIISDKNNKDVLTITNGPDGNSFGKVIIKNGSFYNEMLDEYKYSDVEFENYYDSIIK